MKLSPTGQFMKEFQKRRTIFAIAMWGVLPGAIQSEVKQVDSIDENIVEAVEESASSEEFIEEEVLETEELMNEPATDAEKTEPTEEKSVQEPAEEEELRQVYGWKEWIIVGTKAEPMRAKLDSGARTSSLHAEEIEEFERDGRRWVRFTLRDPRKEDFKQILIKAPIQRIAKVKNTDGTLEERFVVELGFSIGERMFREEFTLNDRSIMICPVLLGRNALRHLGYLDCDRIDLATQKILR